MICAFDTETSGLIPKDSDYTKPHTLPYVLQLSALVYDIKDNKFSYVSNYIAISDDVAIHEKALETHNLDHIFLKLHGIDMKVALEQFVEQCSGKQPTYVAHNIQFDKHMLSIEGSRNGMSNMFSSRAKYVCTMKKYKALCNVISVNGDGEKFVKYQRLDELFKCAFPTEELPSKMHDSLTDTLVCLRCYMMYEHDIDIYKINADFNTAYNAAR